MKAASRPVMSSGKIAQGRHLVLAAASNIFNIVEKPGNQMPNIVLPKETSRTNL